MNGKTSLLVGGLICLLAASSLAQQPSESAVAQVAAKVVGALARLEFTYENEFVGTRKRIGQCICIDAANSVFLTRDIPMTIPRDELRDFFLLPAGMTAKRIKAEFMGIDPAEKLAFVRALEKYPWKELKFVRADLNLGQAVISVGLLGPLTGNVPYIGTARVAARLRLPNEVVYVSGGELTNTSSPVMTTDGRVVGLVAGQIPMEYRMVIGNRPTDVALAGLQTARFFVPVSEFAHVLGQIPRKGESRKLPWMGVWTYKEVSAEESEVMGLNGRPAVLVGQIKVKGPADQAGIKQGDAIVGLNGRPLEALATPALVTRNLQRQLNRFKPGDKVSVSIFRNRKETNRQLTLGPLPLRPYQAARYYHVGLGIAARDFVPFDRYVNRPTPLLIHCVLALLVAPNSPAARGELRPGDLITRVGDKPTPSVEALRNVLKGLAGTTDPIPFMVQRGEDRKVLNIQLPRQ